MAGAVQCLLDSWGSMSPSADDGQIREVCSMNSVDVLHQLLPPISPEWTISHTKSLSYILTVCPPEWLETIVRECSTSSDFKQTLLKMLKQIFKMSEIAERQDTEIYQYDETDFQNCAEKSTCTMQFLLRFFKHLKNMNAQWLLKDIMKTGAKDVIILICANLEQAPWTNNQSLQAALNLKAALLEFYECSTVNELLLAAPDKCSKDKTAEGGCDVICRGTILYQTLEDLRPRLTKWKQNPSFLKVFVVCLFHTKLPHVGDFLCEFLPVALTLVDDHVTGHKELGIKCLLHIIKNTSKTELLWQNRAEVIYEAIKLQLYSKETSLLEQAMPCMFAILDVLEPQSRLHYENYSEVTRIDGKSKHDEIFSMLLLNAEMESRLALRRAYSKFLDGFIKQIGINVVKHSRPLLRLITSYLETYDGPSETARLNTLTVLDMFVIQAWPRIGYHSATILKSLIRLVYDISVDNTLTPVSVKQKLSDKAKQSLLLLKKVCPVKVEDCLKKMLDVETTPQCKDIFQQILDTNLPEAFFQATLDG